MTKAMTLMQKPEILSALTTPFGPDGEILYGDLRINMDRLEPLVDGIFLAGTTGEFLALSPDEHARLVEMALDVFGPERVVVHVGSSSTHQSLKLTAASRALGARRFAAITPYYLKASIEGIARHWAALKQACGGEFYGYIFPDVAVTDLLPQDLPALLASGIDGIKISATASARVAEYIAAAPGLKVWSGDDADLPNVLALGGVGTVSGCSSACPQPWADFRVAYQAGDEDALVDAQRRIDLVVPAIGPSVAALKTALDLQGLTGGSCRMVIDDADENSIRTALAAADCL